MESNSLATNVNLKPQGRATMPSERAARYFLLFSDIDRAISDTCLRAPALVPDLTQAQELLAHTLRDMGSVEEAIRRYKGIIAQRST